MGLFNVLAGDAPEEGRMGDSSLGPVSAAADDPDRDMRLAEAAKDDPQAFAELYEVYYPRVYRYIYHRLRHPADAEDVTGLVFMKALEGLPRYSSGGSFAPWLFRIARNSLIDHYRKQRGGGNPDRLEYLLDDADPENDAIRDEQRRELARLIDRLTPDQRDVILLRYASELSFSEISEITRKREAAVRMLMHRALRRLKMVMEYEQA
ncbi:MAG: RNA polymerase sigma factor [Chloroflexota bacterium]